MTHKNRRGFNKKKLKQDHDRLYPPKGFWRRAWDRYWEFLGWEFWGAGRRQ